MLGEPVGDHQYRLKGSGMRRCIWPVIRLVMCFGATSGGMLGAADGAVAASASAPSAGPASKSSAATALQTTTPGTSPSIGDSRVTLMNGNGIRVLSSKWIDSRLLNVTFSSTVLSAPVGVRILIPADYQRQPRLHFPVLYLLHGGGGSYTDWTTAGHAEQLTAGLPLITVMPAGGGGGWYSNWDNFGAGGPPEWETFHIHQLIPWIDANFRTIPNKAGRAIAGLSMGGFGAIDYAARNPELFAVAASFSGADDMNNPGLL